MVLITLIQTSNAYFFPRGVEMYNCNPYCKAMKFFRSYIERYNNRNSEIFLANVFERLEKVRFHSEYISERDRRIKRCFSPNYIAIFNYFNILFQVK